MRMLGLVLFLIYPVIASGQSTLTTRDSSRLAVQFASELTSQLSSSVGATPSNSVCVEFTSMGVGGAFRRSLESTLRAFTGGALVAPIKIGPMRKIEIVRLQQSDTRVEVTYRASGGGLRRGDWQWGHTVQVPFIRQGDSWVRSRLVQASTGDGYVRADLPDPPLPPNCRAARR